MDAKSAYKIFEKCVADYHLTDDVDTPAPTPYPEDSEEALLYAKCYVDAVQWHLEDIVRDPDIDPVKALEIKRRIDRSNQVRTDMVELLDTRFLEQYSGVTPLPEAVINTESPAWAIDRLSILALKIWHSREQLERTDVDAAHKARSEARLNTLLEQRSDLISAIDTLLSDYSAGRRIIKVYRQMKLYNDPTTNPVLYAKKG